MDEGVVFSTGATFASSISILSFCDHKTAIDSTTMATASASQSTTDTEISSDTSQRICKHMNDDHAVSVYAMAKSLLSKDRSLSSSLTDVSMTRVTMSTLYLRAILCSGDSCEMRQLEYALEPPLVSPTELRPRLVAINQFVCRPQISWLWTKPICPLLIILSAALLYATFGLGIDKFVTAVESYGAANQLVSMLFGSAQGFGKAVAYSAWLVVVLHSAEALYVFYHAIKTLKLKQSIAMLWYVLVTLSGFPITSEFLALMKVHWKAQAAKKKDT
jgi:hypothetical protein